MTRKRSFVGNIDGYPRRFTVKPDSTLVAQINTWKTAKAVINGVMIVKWSASANWTVSKTTTNDSPELLIRFVENDAENDYVLVVEQLCYKDEDSVSHGPGGKVHLFTYAGTPALGDQIQMNGTDCFTVKGVDTGGLGKVLSIDDPVTGKLAAIF